MKIIMKALKHLGVSILLIVLFTSCRVNIFSYSDLRPSAYEYPNDTAKAKELLAEMGNAHGNNVWDSILTYQVIFEEESFGFFGKKSTPYKELNMEFNLNFIPKSLTGIMEIKSGKEKGDIWGMQNGKTYQQENGNYMLKQNDAYQFSMRSFQYFIEFPYRIIDAEVVDYIGTKIIEGKSVEGVLVSWKSLEPQKDIDQFVIWLDQKTNLIVEVEYTVRDKFKFAQGTAEFKEYKEFNGLILPSIIASRSNIKKNGYLHVKKISKFTPDVLSIMDLTPLK